MFSIAQHSADITDTFVSGVGSVRILLHEEQDALALTLIARVLDAAVASDPEHWSRYVGIPMVEDHYAYSTSTRASVVLAKDHGRFYRLTVRPDENEAMARALDIALNEMA